MWDFKFRVVMSLVLQENQLTQEFKVENKGTRWRYHLASYGRAGPGKVGERVGRGRGLRVKPAVSLCVLLTRSPCSYLT